MDCHIKEHAARARRVFRGRRLRIAGGDFHKLQPADLFLLDELAQTRKIVIEAAVEADLQLHARFVGRFKHGFHLLWCKIYGLFAEDMLPGLCRLDGDIRVRIRGGADKHRVDFFIRKHFRNGRVDFFNAEFLLEFFEPLRAYVRDAVNARSGNSICNGLRVELADPPGPDDADIELFHWVPPFLP